MTPSKDDSKASGSSKAKKTTTAAKKTTQSTKTTKTKKPESTHAKNTKSSTKTTKQEKPETHHKKSENKKEESENIKLDPKYIYGAIALILVVIGAILLVYFVAMNGEEEAQQPTIDTPQEDQMDIPEGGDEVLATVNGEEITQDDVVEIIEMVSQQGMQVDEEQALEEAVAITALSQRAEEEGFTVTQAEAEEEIENMLGMSPQEFQQIMEQQGLSYEDEMERLKQDIAIQNFLEDAMSDEVPEVSDEEIEQHYEEFTEMMEMQGQEVPELEEIRDELEAQIQQEQTQPLQQEFLEQVVEEAEVEYN